MILDRLVAVATGGGLEPTLVVDLAAVTLMAGLLPAAAAEGDLAFRFEDPAITESSGLLHLGDRVLTVNDSGDGPIVYVVDPRTGATVGRTTYAGEDPVDVEALAAGPDEEVWVGDIGDNRGARQFISVYRLADAPAAGDVQVVSERFDLLYPDGPRDAEALLVHPRTGRLHVVTKGLFGGRVYAAPRRLREGRPQVLRPQGRATALVTDGAFHPDGAHVLLRSYRTLQVLDARTWRSKAVVSLPRQEQGEGLALIPGRARTLLSSEGSGSEVLDYSLPQRVRAVLAEERAPSDRSGEASPEPAESSTGQRDEDSAALPADRTESPDSLSGDGDGDASAVPGSWWGGVSAVVLAVLGVAWWWAHRRRRGQSRSTM